MSNEERKQVEQATAKPIALQINYENLEQFIDDYAANASLGGIFIFSDELLPVGTNLKILFNLPQLAKMIETTGVVAEVIEPAHDTPSGMGVHFEDIDHQSKHLIDALLMKTMPACYF